MVIQDSDGFLNALVSTLDKHKEKGSVTITLKRSKFYDDWQHLLRLLSLVNEDAKSKNKILHIIR